ncbi:thioredoxin-like domain-containing protein [Flavobacterium sp.]|uniref:TlpA family protein disulfide reductase n=1 Tax=Flavobacterium sp. TaxID=239 RepID=UPI002617C28A|nr:thioredoxin-like domain-containing protein [Flavobacterium sp.]MDD2986056.1 thioredoxin-like domain-containing protein [Flavobacterium sp.]
MIAYSKKLQFSSLFLTLFVVIGCQRQFKDDNFTAYFGGEVMNAKSNFVLFLKDDVVLDTLYLNDKNQFFMKFDSLAPGLYTFKHEPEYQYVYFDKNDSLMVRINSVEFDESVVFCGRGDEKNNFLMELYLKNENDKSKLFGVYDYDVEHFIQNSDSSYQSKTAFYRAKKEELKWNDDFDLYAKAMLDFHYYTKKEIYPIAHKMRTGENVNDKLPANYYLHRRKIDFNNKALTNYSPFVKYLTHMLNNVAFTKISPDYTDRDILPMYIQKLNIADTLFANPSIKNDIIDNIAFSYLLEDQDIENNKTFLKRYNELSTDKSKINEINSIGRSIQALKIGNELPPVSLLDAEGNTVTSDSLFTKKAVVFFWTENADSHLVSVHKKAIEFHKNYPDYEFIAINIDEDHAKWKSVLAKHNFGLVKEYQAKNFQELKEKWVITKLNRTMIIDKDRKIINGFVNLFEVNFADNLK